MSAPSVGEHESPSTTRWWSFGQAVRNGISAALAVKAGLTADLNILRGKLLPGVFGITPDLAAMSGVGPGAVPAVSQVSFKPWCAARQTMAATQALRELMARGVPPDRIASVEAFVVPLHLKMIGQGIDREDRGSFMKSVSYQMAVAALAPAHRFDLGPAEGMPTPAVGDFMRRIKVAADQELLPAYPKQWPARIVVRTHEGARHECRVDDVPGDPARPIDLPELTAKFCTVVAAAGVQDAERCWAGALGLLESAGGEDVPVAPFRLRADTEVRL
jgi:2-methylcitrate dehydratase PrpD